MTTFMTFVFAAMLVSLVVFTFGDNTLFNGIQLVNGWLWSPCIKVAVSTYVVVMPKPMEPVFVHNHDLEEDWDVVSDDSDPVLWNGDVVPVEEHSELTRVFFGEDLEFVTEEVIPSRRNKNHTMLAGCDYSMDSEDNYVASSKQWVDNIKVAVVKDRANRTYIMMP